MEINWAEETGLWLSSIAPLILSIGLVCIFVEFGHPALVSLEWLGLSYYLFSSAQNMLLDWRGRKTSCIPAGSLPCFG